MLAGAPWRRAIGKMLLAEGAAVAEILLAGALMRRCSWQGRCSEEPSGRYGRPVR